MIYADAGSFQNVQLEPGRAIDKINSFFGRRRADRVDYPDAREARTTSRRSPLEERLRDVQKTISSISMHLPKGFVAGLNRQFANLMADDAWEDDDELVSPVALKAFLLTLVNTQTQRRPGIGSNGHGSITAAWTVGGNRLTIEFLPSGQASLVLSRLGDSGEVERAAFGPIRPARIREVLAPYRPEVWFDR